MDLRDEYIQSIADAMAMNGRADLASTLLKLHASAKNKPPQRLVQP